MTAIPRPTSQLDDAAQIHHTTRSTTGPRHAYPATDHRTVWQQRLDRLLLALGVVLAVSAVALAVAVGGGR